MLSIYFEYFPYICTRFELAGCYWTCLGFLLQFVSIFGSRGMNLILSSPVHTIRELAGQRAQLKEHELWELPPPNVPGRHRSRVHGSTWVFYHLSQH